MGASKKLHMNCKPGCFNRTIMIYILYCRLSTVLQYQIKVPLATDVFILVLYPLSITLLYQSMISRKVK